MKLNLGANDIVVPGFLAVDVCEPADVIADLRQDWPWTDSSVTEIRAHDVFEHLPSIIHTMNEVHRVLIPGGILDLIVPTTSGQQAFQDPQHCSWWTKYTKFYFGEEFEEWKRFKKHYGITANFKFLQWDHKNYWTDPETGDKGWKVFAKLEAIK